jgi:CopG family nickel-responsive transcriptional regulator
MPNCWPPSIPSPTVAALCIVYDHKTGDLARRLAALQHKHSKEINATLHIHLDARNCLEVTVLRGSPGRLRRLADQVIGTRGVKHGQLVMTTSGKGLS